ncbi:MAG TPA: ABC transporter ATP-binding protein [Mobilitalea sp.]|nr:ABC transporter ATP-binding protein [Mobilitalea sp.]
MNLKYSLPKDEAELISLSDKETICYCSPYDIGEKAEERTGGYVVVTNLRLVVLYKEGIRWNFLLKDCERIRCEALVDNGILVIRMNGIDYLTARFSMKHVARFSYIARGAELLSKGEELLVVSKEKERICPRCGKALPGTNSCPHCDGHLITLRRFWTLCGSFQVRLVAISIFMVLASVISLIMPEVQKRFIDDILVPRNGDFHDVLIFLAKMLILTMALLAVNLTRNWWCVSLGAGISMDLRKRLYYKIQVLSLSFMNKRKPGDLMNRVIRDTTNIRKFMEDIFSNMVSTLVTMCGAFVAMMIMDPLLTLVSTVFILAVIFLNQAFRKKTRRMFHTQGRKDDNVNSALQDVISGIRVVKAFGKEKEEADHFQEKTVEYAAITKKNEVFWAYFFPIIAFIMGIGVYFATYFGGINVLNGRMTTGELIQFITYTNILYGPLRWMNRLPRMFRQMVNSLERTYDVLDEEPEITDTEEAKDIMIRGRVEFKNVSFGYKTYEQVLTDIDLKVEPGEMIGLVGSSGTGKSTMINLLMRLYDIDQGEITIDGTDIRRIKADSLHSQIGVVLQETFLFTGTILNNILFAKPEATMEEIIMAAKAANAHDFIVKMPDGYNTYVGEHGYTISGGERQRIAIARAILNDPKLLILDEATSSLDTESEYLIQQALNRLRQGRTTFAIAHRLSTLREANRLVVIDGHHIAEIGTHNELMEKQGIYYKLVTAQLEMQKVEG